MSWGRQPVVNLKVGDDIAVISTGWSRRTERDKVSRVTKTLIIDSKGRRWRNKDGDLQGQKSRFSGQHIEPWSPKHAQDRREQLREAKWSEGVYFLRDGFTKLDKIPEKKQATAVRLLTELVELLKEDES